MASIDSQRGVPFPAGRSRASTTAAAGVVVGFWHIRWIAGAPVLASGLVGIGVHSAGYVRLEFKEPGHPDPGAPG